MNTFTRFRRFALPFVLLFFTTLAAAQVTTIRGRVVTQDKSPAVGANIYLRDTYDGATSDAEGNFSFDTEETGPQTLLVIYLGFDTAVQQVTLKGGVFEFNPVLKEAFNEMKLVVISAGSFEASDEKKVTVLKPLDIVTTASAGGDTYGALKTLPGTQVSSGDQEGLFVRRCYVMKHNKKRNNFSNIWRRQWDSCNCGQRSMENGCCRPANFSSTRGTTPTAWSTR